MKRLILLAFTLLITSFILVACANNDNTQINEANDPEVNETENDDKTNNQGDMEQKMAALDYKKFELEVNYPGNKEYEAEIEFEHERVSAELEDELTNEDLEGQAAFDKIYPIIQTLTIDQSTAKEDAIKQVLEAFDLDADTYEKIEIEITFNDNTKIEFEDKK